MIWNERSYKGHLVVGVAYLFFGLNIPAVKSVVGVAGITGWSVTFYRMAGAAVLFWVASIFIKPQRVPLRDVGWLFVASMFCILLNQMPFIVGVSMTAPIDAAVITTLTPMLTMCLSALFLKEPITWLKVVGVGVGASGALLLILSGGKAVGQGSMAGNVLCAVSSLSFAIYLTAFKRLIRTYSPVTLMRWMFLFAALGAAPFCWRDVAAVDYSALGAWDWTHIGFIVGGATFLTFFFGSDRPAVVAPDGAGDVQLYAAAGCDACFGGGWDGHLRPDERHRGSVGFRGGLARHAVEKTQRNHKKFVTLQPYGEEFQ